MFIEATYTDPVRVECVRRMCQNGTYLGHVPASADRRYYCVDGKVWLVTPSRAVRLGDYGSWAQEVRMGARKVAREEVPACS